MTLRNVLFTTPCESDTRLSVNRAFSFYYPLATSESFSCESNASWTFSQFSVSQTSQIYHHWNKLFMCYRTMIHLNKNVNELKFSRLLVSEWNSEDLRNMNLSGFSKACAFQCLFECIFEIFTGEIYGLKSYASVEKTKFENFKSSYLLQIGMFPIVNH